MFKLKFRSGYSTGISNAMSLIVIIAACIVIAGGLFPIAIPQSVLSGDVQTGGNVAFLFILAGITLFLINTSHKAGQFSKIMIRLFPWMMVISGLAFMTYYILKGHPAIQNFFLMEQQSSTAQFFASPVSPVVSLNFILLGFTLMMIGFKKNSWLTQVFLFIIISGSLLMVMNHVFEISFFDSIPLSDRASILTALLFLVLALGIFFSPALDFLHFSFIKRITAFLIIIFMIRSVVFFAINKNGKESAEEFKTIERNGEINFLLGQLNSRVNEIQDDTKDYLITGNETYKSGIASLSDSVSSIIQKLDDITKTNAGQRQNIDSLEMYIKSFIEFQRGLTAIRRNAGFDSLRKTILGNRGQLLQSGIQSLIVRIEQKEVLYFTGLNARNQKDLKRSSKLFTLLQIGAFCLLIIALIIIYKNSQRRNKIEKELRDSLKNISDYQYALDKSSILVITDQKGIITHVNDNFCKISQYKKEELIGSDHGIVNSAYHPKEFFRDLWLTIQNGEVWRNEIKNKAKDGSCFWLDTTIVPFMDESGKPYQFLSIRSDITQRKELKETIVQFNRDLQQTVDEKTKEVIEKEQQYRFVLQNMMEGIQIIGKNMEYLFLNNSAVAQSHYRMEELLGYTMMEKYPGVENSPLFEMLQTCLKTGKARVIENLFTYPGGDTLWFELSIQPIKEGLLILSTDVTARKDAMKKLVESETLLRTIVETDPDFLMVMAKDGELQKINSAGLAMIEADHIGQSNEIRLTDIIEDGYKARFDKLVTDVFKGMPDKMEFEITGLKGTRRWAEIHAVPLKNDEGKIISLLGVIRDITERKKSEEELREGVNRHELINKATQDTLWEWDLITGTVIRNDIFTKIYGYKNDPENNTHEWVLTKIHPDDRESALEQVKNCIENKQESWQHEYRLMAADGSYKYVYDRAYIRFDEEGKPFKMIGAMTDLTAKKEMEKELVKQRLEQQKQIIEVAIQSQEKEKNELGKELHDNVNQILAAVKIYLSILKNPNGAPEGELLDKSYDYVNMAINELRKLSHSLVSPSLGDAGLEEALSGLVNDAQLLNQWQVELSVDKNYKKQITDKKLELMLYRIVQEQFTNIIKHANATVVGIYIHVENAHLRLTVTDNGAGFDVSAKAKGIGLKNIRNRVAFYSGEVTIVSSPGNGCKLEVFIPLPNTESNSASLTKTISLNSSSFR